MAGPRYVLTHGWTKPFYAWLAKNLELDQILVQVKHLRMVHPFALRGLVKCHSRYFSPVLIIVYFAPSNSDVLMCCPDTVTLISAHVVLGQAP